MGPITKYYPAAKFARNRSYPAFGNSSIDHNMGNGSKEDGDREGGINLGFDWKDVVDEEGKWSVTVSNDLAKEAMTVDVTPRRCQKFKLKPGTECKWTTSTGASGTVDRRPVGAGDGAEGGHQGGDGDGVDDSDGGRAHRAHFIGSTLFRNSNNA